MSASELNSFRDGLHGEGVELFVRISSGLKSELARYTQKCLTVPSDRACSGTLEKRAREAIDAFFALAGTLGKELSELSDVRNKFFESLAKTVKVDATAPLGITEDIMAQLSEEELKRALVLAVWTIEYSRRMTVIATNQVAAFASVCDLREKQFRKWDEKSSELAETVKAREQQTKRMAASLKSCSKRLNTRVSTSPTVAKGNRDQVAVLEESVMAVEKLLQAEHEKVKQLEGRIAEAEKQFEATRDLLADSTAKIENLRNQLLAASQNGQTYAARAEELEEKLQCSICMDRPKNVAFACGHTSCDECASKWKRCTLNCKGPKSQKPVKHTFRLY